MKEIQLFHFVYKTTNLVNNKYYIGVHSSESLDDGYLGSGLKLSRSINKHGAFNHSRVFIKFFDTCEDAFAHEAELVTQELIDSDKLCLNLKPGGSGGWAYSDTARKASKSGVAKQKWLRENDESWRQAISIAHVSRWESLRIAGREVVGGFNGNPDIQAEMCIRAQSPEANAKRKATQQKINHQQGSKNSQFGTAWVSNSVHTVKISVELLHEYESNGYVRGRKLILPS